MDDVHKKVSMIAFGLLSPKEIKKMVAVKIVTAELYDKEGYPVDGGLMDTRLGVIDPGLKCKTCGERLKECIGHFGYIDLARPIVHVAYVNKILEVLKSVCSGCSRLLLKDEDIKALNEKLNAIKHKKGVAPYRKTLKTIASTVRLVNKCPHCEKDVKKHTIEKPTNFYEAEKRLSPIEIRNSFEKISDVEAMLLGFDVEYARPEWMVLTVLQIPPVTIRPSITLETGEHSEDDLTHKLGDIIRINQRLFENINAGAPEIIVEDLWDLLQYHITTYFDNTITRIPPARHRSGQPLKTLVERIKSKEGRFRHNLVGKRVNYAARTVISPDAKIRLNEVGVPYQVAKELTVPERVTAWNIEWLKAFVKRGKLYPGSNYVISSDGKKKKITEETKEQLLEELTPGYIVERHLIDKDVVIFNRQPSLHKMSIMCHKVRVLPGRSFRLNPAVCTPYNADFDGDEMNLHVPQTEEARAEAEILMQVQNQIITPKNGMNIIGCVEDSITGNYLLTKWCALPKADAVNLLISIGCENTTKKMAGFKNTVTGKEIFSIILPDNFNLSAYSKSCINLGNCEECEKNTRTGCEIDAHVQIRKGELLSGIIDSTAIGESNGSIIRALHRDYGEDVTLDVLGKIFRLGIMTLFNTGFTMGISHINLSKEQKDVVSKLLKDAEADVTQQIQLYKEGRIEAMPSKTVDETLELLILQILNQVRNKISDMITRFMDEKNPVISMARSGARGNILYLSQMAACVGQQALRGRRIEKGYANRTLPLFQKNDLAPAARGFVGKGLIDGLSPHEFFFSAITGRDSLMDTALRTPKSGYLYRRLANALQDMRIEYDNTVRDANMAIIQFCYGEDGVDVAKSEGGTINIRKIVGDIAKNVK